MNDPTETPIPAFVDTAPAPAAAPDAGAGGAEKDAEKDKEKESLFRGLRDLVTDVVKVVVAILLIWHFVAHPSVVKGQSMEPTFHNDDRLMVDLLTYKFSPIERGDIVVLKNPSNPKEDFIKRVIGLPGDWVEIVQGVVRVNDEPIDEPYLEKFERRSFKRTRVPNAHYFVLGDNRTMSKDSRDAAVGPVPEDYIRGKIRMRFWPLDQFEIF